MRALAAARGARALPALAALGLLFLGAAPAPPPAPQVPRVEVRRAAGSGIELSLAVLQGSLLAITAAPGPAGRPGLALLTAAHRDGTGARQLLFLEPGRPALDRLAADLPARADALTSAGPGGRDGLLIGAPGALWAPVPGWKPGVPLARVLAAPGLGLLARAIVRAEPWVALAGPGRLQLAGPGAAGDPTTALVPGASFPLPLSAERTGWGVQLASPPLHLLPTAEGPVALAGPELAARRRLRTTVVPLARGEPWEAWARLPADEQLAEASYARWDGRPVLLAATFGRLALSERKGLRIFPLRADRTRAGSAPLLARRTGCAVWNHLETTLADVDGDGRPDLVLLHPDGLRGKSLRLQVFRALGRGRFEERPREAVLPGEPAAWTYGGDWTGDGLPDLAVLAGGKLLLYPGAGRDRLPAARPAWALPVGPLHPEGELQMQLALGAGSSEPTRTFRAGSAAEGLFAMADLDGDGRPEIVLTGADHLGGVRVVVVRRAP